MKLWTAQIIVRCRKILLYETSMSELQTIYREYTEKKFHLKHNYKLNFYVLKHGMNGWLMLIYFFPKNVSFEG